MRLLFFALLIYLAFKAWATLARKLPGKRGRPREKTLRGEDMVQDPRCGVYLPRGDALSATVGGKHYFFCSEACRDAFAAGK